jgi:hypothetical protein
MSDSTDSSLMVSEDSENAKPEKVRIVKITLNLI